MAITKDLTCTECGGKWSLYGLAAGYYGTSYKHWCSRTGWEHFASTVDETLPSDVRQAMSDDGERWRGVSAANAAAYRAGSR
jgi:hypothetical protein